MSYWERIHTYRDTSISGQISESSSDSSDDESEEVEVEFEDDITFLRSLDPKAVKDQDHYKVLGLTQLRAKATPDQIKRAHRY